MGCGQPLGEADTGQQGQECPSTSPFKLAMGGNQCPRAAVPVARAQALTPTLEVLGLELCSEIYTPHILKSNNNTVPVKIEVSGKCSS